MIIQNRRFWFATILNTNSSGLVFPLNQQSYSASSCQKERADNRILICVLSALRLCVWLFDNCGIQLFYID